MSAERENYASRRAILSGAPALAVAAVMAETGIALASASDPYVSLGATYHRHWKATNASTSDDDVTPEYRAWRDTCDRLIATRPTTVAGVLAGLKVAQAEYREFFTKPRPCQGEQLIAALLNNAVVVLEREAAHV